MLEITSIKNGFVLDHIKAGVGVKIFKYLNLEKEGNQVALIINADFVTKTVEEDGILYALEEFGLVEKQLHFPQVDLENVEGPVAIKPLRNIMRPIFIPLKNSVPRKEAS